MTNYLSIDFESWAYPDIPEFKQLSSEERKSLDGEFVKYSAERILKVLAKYKTKLTFFVLGELYEWYPEVIDWIAQEGHEIAYHTHRHDLLTSSNVLTKTLDESSGFLGQFKPKGFRAPEIFIKSEYLPILKNYGFTYDSSIYGSFSLKREVAGITEIPISTSLLFGRKSRFRMPRGFSVKDFFIEPPVGSGYLIATLGQRVGWFYERLNKMNQPVVAFMHNWQIVKPQKATFPDMAYLLTHPTYLPYTKDCYKIFEYLLANFEFDRMANILKN